MNVHIGYKVRKTPDIEKEINQQVEKLRKRLQAFRPELIHLKGLIEESSPREGVIVSLNLRLPSGQMAAQKKASVPSAAVKAAFDDLLQQITHLGAVVFHHRDDEIRSQKNVQVGRQQSALGVQTNALHHREDVPRILFDLGALVAVAAILDMQGV